MLCRDEEEEKIFKDSERQVSEGGSAAAVGDVGREADFGFDPVLTNGEHSSGVNLTPSPNFYFIILLFIIYFIILFIFI